MLKYKFDSSLGHHPITGRLDYESLFFSFRIDVDIIDRTPYTDQRGNGS